MNEISRQSGQRSDLGVHSICQVGFTVPDLAIAKAFYSSFGLDVRSEDGRLSVYTEGQPYRWLSISQGPRKALSHISFGAFEADMPPFREKLKANGIPEVEAPQGFEINGLWFRDPAGLLLEIRVADKTSPDNKASLSNELDKAGVRCAPNRSRVALIKPKRLAHTMIFTVDLERAINFYSNILGLRLTDQSSYDVAFMHAMHGSDHHILGLVGSTAPGLHHTSWQVDSINEVGLGAMQMAKKGFSVGWGVGRHVLGSNYFFYVRDPWDSFAEYSAGIDYIPEGLTWRSEDHPPEDSFYVWGPDAPADFTTNHEAA